MSITRDHTKKPAWYGGRGYDGRIVIRAGPEAQALLDAQAYERTAPAWIARDRSRTLTTAPCAFCGGRITRMLGEVSCEDCGRPPGSPIEIAQARVIVPTLLRCDGLVVDTLDRSEDGFYTVAFHVGEDVNQDTSGAIETMEQWRAWSALAGATR